MQTQPDALAGKVFPRVASDHKGGAVFEWSAKPETEELCEEVVHDCQSAPCDSGYRRGDEGTSEDLLLALEGRCTLDSCCPRSLETSAAGGAAATLCHVLRETANCQASHCVAESLVHVVYHLQKNCRSHQKRRKRTAAK